MSDERNGDPIFKRLRTNSGKKKFVQDPSVPLSSNRSYIFTSKFKLTFFIYKLEMKLGMVHIVIVNGRSDDNAKLWYIPKLFS